MQIDQPREFIVISSVVSDRAIQNHPHLVFQGLPFDISEACWKNQADSILVDRDCKDCVCPRYCLRHQFERLSIYRDCT